MSSLRDQHLERIRRIATDPELRAHPQWPAAMLAVTRTLPCPGNRDTCMCRECHVQRTDPDAPARVVLPKIEHDMTCECHQCERERAAIVRSGPKPEPKQPWMPKPARRAA